jgi:hypothetical protein
VVSRARHPARAAAPRFRPFAFLSRGAESLRARRSLQAARNAADVELLRSPVPSLSVAWRAAELVVPRKRLGLARSFRRLLRDADPRYLAGAQPFDRNAVRAAAEHLRAIAGRLENLERPVAPCGVLLAERLFTDGASPLYDRSRPGALALYLEATLASLELP